MKTVLSALVFIVITCSSVAQIKYTIKGKVIDCETKETIPFAIVVCDDKKTATNTDLDGLFTLNLMDEIKTIEVRYLGYQTEMVELGRLKIGEALNMEICLNLYDGSRIDDKVLPDVVVEGLRTNKPIIAIPASVGLVDGSQLQTGDQTSIQNAVNTIPGVIMEQRGYGGSHRINIRGSAFRSPFAVRNIKMYMDGIPLTSPDGQAPLEMVDASELQSIEIIKGPAGSIWGSGNGGVIHMHSSDDYIYLKQLSSQVEMGSYDLSRTVNKYKWGNRKSGINVSHIFQDNPGYRQQEYNHKNQFVVHGTYKPNAKNSFLFYGNYFDGRWALPGGLNAIQADTLPTQASQYSWINNANVWRERVMVGVSHKHQFDKWTSARAAVYGYLTNKENPFGTSAFSNGYKVEGANGTGMRTDWNKFIRLDRSRLNRYVQLAWGGEYQFERYAINESSLLNGQPDDFRYRYDVDYHSGMAFFSADLSMDDTYFVNAGVSANRVLQLVEGNTSSDFSYDTKATWNWALLPRIAFNWQFKKNWYSFVSASAGNANPTVFEMVDYENNSYNLSLNPERGLNLEAGIKSKQYDNKWNFELNAYRFYLSNAIVSYQDTLAGSANEIYRYTNAGSTVQQGIEWKLQLQLNKFFDESSRLMRIQFHHSGSVYDYVFDDFKIEDGQYDGIQFAGNKLPGVPLMTLSNLLVVNFFPAIQLDVQHQWFDKVPLNNQNSTWAGAYNLLNVKVSYQITLLKKLTARVFAGVNNLTNAKYTSFYGLNNEFNRFYNPSPPTNYFGGLSLSWTFDDRRVEILPD